MTLVDRGRLPSPAGEPPFAFPLAGKRRLSNGLGLWTVERPGLPIVSIVLLLPAGSVRDPAGMPGLAALTADMLDEGSGTRSAIDVQEALGRIGTELDTEIGPDSVVLSLTLLARFVPEGLRLLADVAARPALSDADFDRVRALRANRLRQLRNVPGVTADAVFLNALYDGHGYGHLPFGSSSSLAGLRAADVAGFHRSHYRPARATLIGVGAIAPDAFEADAAEAFGSWHPDLLADAGYDRAEAVPPVQAGSPPRLLLIDRPGAAQTELRIGHVGAARGSGEFYALVLLNAVLGGHFMSRLNLNLRERKGYTYGARSSFDFRRMPGPFSVQTSVQTDATADAAVQILEELDGIRNARPARDDEITLSVSTLTKGYPRNFETTGQVARGLAQLALLELPDDSFAVFGPRIRELDVTALTRAARTYLRPEAATVVAVGDRERIQAALERLGLGEAVVTTADI
jgi:zinc protease